MHIQYFIVITKTFEQSIIMLRYYAMLLRFIVQLLHYIYVRYVNRPQYFLLPSALITCLRLLFKPHINFFIYKIYKICKLENIETRRYNS